MTDNTFNQEGLPYYIFDDTPRRLVERLADYYNCPKDYIVAGMVQVVATALGKKFRLKVGAYSNRPNMFIAIVGRSGINKSTPLKYLMRPLYDIDNDLYQEFKEKVQEVEMRNKAIKKDNKGKPIEEQEQLMPRPLEQDIILSDTTPEKRNEILANLDETDKFLLIYFDELPALFKQFGRYNNSSDIEDMLTFFDGSRYKITRKSSDTISIKESTMAILGTIQENVLEDTFADKSMLKNGFNQRWLFVMPERTPIPHDSLKSMDAELTEWWYTFIKQDIYLSTSRGEMGLQPDALKRYFEYKNGLIDEMNLCPDDNEGAYRASTLAKLHILCLKWAMATHFLTKNKDNPYISLNEIEYAIQSMQYFSSTSTKVFNLVQKSAEIVEPIEPAGSILYKDWEEASKSGVSIKEYAEKQGVSWGYLYRIIRKYKTRN